MPHSGCLSEPGHGHDWCSNVKSAQMVQQCQICPQSQPTLAVQEHLFVTFSRNCGLMKLKLMFGTPSPTISMTTTICQEGNLPKMPEADQKQLQAILAAIVD